MPSVRADGNVDADGKVDADGNVDDVPQEGLTPFF
jgi:hypothetical protein